MRLFIFIILTVYLSIFASAQEGSIPDAKPPVEIPPAETPMPTPDTGSTELTTPRPVEPAPVITTSAAKSPSPAQSLNPSNLPSATPQVSPTPSEAIPEFEPVSSDSRLGTILLAVGAFFGLSGIIYTVTRQQKKSKKEGKDEGKCDNMRSLLEQKQKEYEEMVRGWPEEKLKSLAEKKVRDGIKKNKDAGEMLEALDEVQAKYNKTVETIELLQTKYDLCMLEFNRSTQKRAFIIHGWGGYPEEGWLPWLKKELTTKGYTVTVPAMPDTDVPKIEAWISHLEKLVGKPDKNTFFVGHSIGCQTILRYLESLPRDSKIGGAVFVAGFFTLSELETEEEKIIGKPWLETPIDFEKIKATTDNFTAIFSKDDSIVPLEENRKLFIERLNAKTIIEDGRGHFSGSDGVTELPSALEALS